MPSFETNTTFFPGQCITDTRGFIEVCVVSLVDNYTWSVQYPDGHVHEVHEVYLINLN